MNFRDKIIKYGSYFLVFSMPLVFFSHWIYAYVSSKTFFIYGVVEALFFVWLYVCITDRSYRLNKKIILYFVPLLAFIFWMSLAGIFAVSPGLSFWSSFGRGTGLLTLYHCLAASFVVASLVKKNGVPYVLSLFQWFVAGSFILALSIWIGSEGLRFSGKVFEFDGGGGLSGNSTVAATYFLFALAMSVFLLTVKGIANNKKKMIAFSIATIIFSPVFINIHGLFIGGGLLGSARGTLLALITGGVVACLGYMFFSKKKVIRGTSIAIVSVGIIVFGVLWGQLMTPNTMLYEKFSEQARGSRFIFWEIAQKSMNEHVVFGYGPENFALAFQTHFDPQILLASNSFEGWADRAHNLYYDTGVAGGYPAVLFYGIFLFCLLYVVYDLRKTGTISRVHASLFIGLFTAYIVNNLFTFDSTLSLMALFVLTGVLYSLDSYEIKQKMMPVKISSVHKNIYAGLLSILFVWLFIYCVYMPVIKIKEYANAFSHVINTHPETYMELSKGSSVGSHWDISGLAFDKYRAYVENPTQLKNDKQKLPYVLKDLDALIAHLYKVSETNTTDYRLYATIAFLENTKTYMSDRSSSAEIKNQVLSVLEKARTLSPTNPNVYWTIAQTKVWSGDFPGAEEAYQQAVAVAPMLPGSYNLLLRYAQALNNSKLFNETLTKAQHNILNFKYN